MAFEFHFQTSTGGALVARLSGELTLGPHLRRFGEQALDNIERKRPGLIALDMAAVTSVDSAGLGELVILFTAAGGCNCRLVLLNPPARIRDMLVTTRLDGLLPSYRTVEEASRPLSGTA